jgi:pilus assembly protein CpaD
MAVALAALSLAACQGERTVTGSIPLTIEERHPHYVTPEQVVLDLPTRPDGMNPAERGAVRDFVAAYRREGGGAFEVVAPSGSRNEGESQIVIAQVRKIARKGGVPGTALSYSTYHSKQARPPVMLRYTRHAGSAKCGQWPENLDSHWRNENYYNFGCATQRNLAAMIEDPRDLQGPRRTTPRDSERRDTVFDNYRQGQPTGAATSTDGAATASDIGN